MDEQEQKAISDLLRTVRIGILVMALCAGAIGTNEMTGLI